MTLPLLALLALVIFYYFFQRNRFYRGPKSDHFDGERFFNPWNNHSPSFKKFLLWRFTARPKQWPEKVENLVPSLSPRKEGAALTITFVGHATVFIQTEGLNILTDPVWSKRASPFSWAGPKRVAAPGIAFEKLPKIDLLLISHNHYDHLDVATIQKLWERDRPKIVAPLGNDAVIHAHHPSIEIETLDWLQSIDLNGSTALHLAPLQHWSSRNVWDKNRALWGAFILKTASGSIYFAGDTGYGSFFQQAYKSFGPFRLALLPIGAYEPRWFMHPAHMNPEEALRAHLDLGSPYTLGIHFGTFQMADEGYEDPLNDLASARQKYPVSEKSFRTLKVGESWEVPHNPPLAASDPSASTFHRIKTS